MNLDEVLAKITSDSGRTIARKAGINERTFLHQVSNGKMPLENLIKVASAYGASPIRALIDLGEIDEAWTRVPDIDAALRLADDEQLTDELLRRIKASPNPMWDEPVGDLEARRRAKKSNTSAKDVQPAWDSDCTMPEDAVAKDGKEWGQPDDDDY